MTMARSEDCGPLSISGSRADAVLVAFILSKSYCLICCTALLSQGTPGPRENCQYLLPLFGAAMVSLPGVALS